MLTLILATAVASTLLTTLVLFFLWRRVLVPELDRRLEERLDRARAELEGVIEKSARKGFAEALAASLPSREVLQDTTINVARSGMELLGEGLNTLLGTKRGRRLTDRERPGGAEGKE